MKSKKLSILLAVLALIISTLACALGGEPTLSNVRTAKDQDGAQPASIFATTETVFVDDIQIKRSPFSESALFADD